MPNSTAPWRTVSTTSSATASFSRTLICGCCSPNALRMEATQVQAIICEVATRRKPRRRARISDAPSSTWRTSSRMRCASGSRLRPASVSVMAERPRSKSCRRSSCSSCCTSMLTADCVRLSWRAAPVKLPLCVTAAKARIWRRLMFMADSVIDNGARVRDAHRHQVL